MGKSRIAKCYPGISDHSSDFYDKPKANSPCSCTAVLRGVVPVSGWSVGALGQPGHAGTLFHAFCQYLYL